MTGRTRFSLAALFVAMLLSAVTAAAQPLVWNRPCLTLRVKNVTGVPVSINLNTTPPGAIPAPINVGPFSDVTVGPVPVGMTVNSLTSLGLFVYPVVQPGPPSPPAPIAANGWISNVTVGPPPGSCVDIYLDLANCTVYVFPTTAPPPCGP